MELLRRPKLPEFDPDSMVLSHHSNGWAQAGRRARSPSERDASRRVVENSTNATLDRYPEDSGPRPLRALGERSTDVGRLRREGRGQR
jgi:hypothetical protein